MENKTILLIILSRQSMLKEYYKVFAPINNKSLSSSN